MNRFWGVNGNDFSGDRRLGNRIQRTCPGRIVVISQITLPVRLRVPRSAHEDPGSGVGDVNRAAEKPRTPAKDPMETNGVTGAVARAEIIRAVIGFGVGGGFAN